MILREVTANMEEALRICKKYGCELWQWEQFKILEETVRAIRYHRFRTEGANMNSLDEMIAVLTARKAGKTVQWKFHSPIMGAGEDWTDLINVEHPFNFSITDYRIKPEPPKPREWWAIAREGELERYRSVSLYSCAQELLPGQIQIHLREVLEETSVVKP